MRWTPGKDSPDVIDRRGERAGGGGPVAMQGLFAILPLLMRSKLGWLAIVLIVAFLVFGGGLRGMLGGDTTQKVSERPGAAAPRDAKAQFVGFVLDDAQRAWNQQFAESGREYRNAKLVLFTDATQSGCGYGEAATGPFYCPTDERVYIDLAFYDDLDRRFGAKGDFAQAYVIAHEIGHHVQKLLGVSDRVHAASRSQQEGAGGLSVRLELQADCYAGMWARSTARRDLLETGDIEEGLGAASAIGDDKLQKQATGRVRPESFTHGTSEQRVRRFKRGYEQGTMEGCDTFGTRSL
jgi:predicted metalloprotease